MTNISPKVSVIIPVYNVEQYIRKCLDSVINQTYTNLEIICVDDGSPDNSSAILDEYAQKDSRIIVIHQENAGVSAARNKGLEIATGEYISFVDSDDWLEAECYELAIKAYLTHPSCDLVNFFPNTINFNNQITENEFLRVKNWTSISHKGLKKISTGLVCRMLLDPWSHLYKSSIIRELNLKYFDYKISEDVLFNMMYISKVENIYFIDRYLYNYVLRKNSAMNTISAQQNCLYALTSHVNATLDALEFYKQQNQLNKFNELIFKRFFNTILWDLNYATGINDKIINELTKLVNALPDEYSWGKEVEYLRKRKYYKLAQLKLPWLNFDNYIIGLKVYRYQNPKLILKFLGIKISMHYQKLFSIKNIDNYKVLNIFGLRIKFSKEKNFKTYINKLLHKTFYIYNEYQNNKKFKIINILGIKIKFLTTFEKLLENFIKNNNQYINRNNKEIKRRLFLTTGNLSLINNLAIIRQLNETNCEDELLILSNISNKKFFDTCKAIAKIHNFKNIYTVCTKDFDLRELLIRHKLYKIDEIFYSNQYQFIYTVTQMYPNAIWNLTDEGCGNKLARNKYLDYNKVNKIIMHNFLGKLDFFGLSVKNMQKIVDIDKHIFDKVAAECAELYPLELNLTPQDKTVIFCGSWWEISGMSKDDYINLQNSYLEKLINLGYKILFKPHPRDPRNYINNKSIIILDTYLPLECYKPDVAAIVSICSSATLHCPYMSDVAGFAINIPSMNERKLDHKWLDTLVKKLIVDYTTPIEELLSVNPELYSPSELKQVLLDKCFKYINSKPLLSQNEEFKQFAYKRGYTEEKREGGLLCQ